MKKYLLILTAIGILVFNYFSVPQAHAQTTTTTTSTVQPPDGAWLSDNDVTFAGKNAARAKDLFNWVLVNYQWSTDNNTLISFWATIRNIVFVFLILLVMVSAFLMIITGGQSLTAMQFIRKFLIAIILITFSFAIIRILYQIVDVIQGFFIKNPDGKIISSADLLNISFNYQDFMGYRRYGPEYNESAFISLLLTKLTAATYFVMAGVLLIRKVILWFFITVSPIYPVLLLYFPIRNTAKIWIGEFFRWLLYAPLFAIFLSGLVVLWRQNINVLPFHFDAAGAQPTIVYPTAINILLGGPGQKLAIDNNINYTDTFAEYIVALIMLWVVIFLPFLLLRIFLDYLSTVSVNNNPAWKYITNNANKILPSNDFFRNTQQTPPPPAPPTFFPTGTGRELPFPTGAARTISVGQPISRAQTTNIPQYQTMSTNTRNIAVAKPVYKSEATSNATSQLVSFPIPTMRDVARYETSRLSSQVTSHQEISRVNETLQKIANPQSITNPIERQQFTQIREKLVQAQSQGEPLASSILHAANNITSRITTTSITNTTRQISRLTETINQQARQGDSYATNVLNKITNLTQRQEGITNIQNIANKLVNPQAVTNTTEKEQITSFREKITELSKQGNPVATNVLNAISNVTQNNREEKNTQMQTILEQLANPQTITNTTEREQVKSLKDKLIEQVKQGNSFVSTILTSLSSITSHTAEQKVTQMEKIVEKLAKPEKIQDIVERQQITKLKEELAKEKQNGNPLATSILNAVDQFTQQQAQSVLPTTNQVQTVNLEDYEEVKKTWTENYRNLDVPKTLDHPDRTREEWITQDLTKTTHAIESLQSQDPKVVQQGMNEVSALLPFLLVGGFSQTEIVAYLQAKKHAAEEVLSETQKKQDEQDTLLEKKTHHQEKEKHLQESLENSDNVASEKKQGEHLPEK